jgi:protein-S-isoprenylcysteine O-methyltransferase Ste14
MTLQKPKAVCKTICIPRLHGHYAIAENPGGAMQESFRKLLEWPQAWAGLALLAIWAIGLLPSLIGFGGFGPGLALACASLGIWLMLAAMLRMRRAGTTVNPRGQSQTLITDGVFATSRNPIFLGDALILMAAVMFVNEAFALPVVAGFIWVINDPFIPVEEERLADAFGDQAAEYFLRVRRWI